MDFGEEKRQSPYSGIWVVCIFLVVIPLVAYFITRAIVFKYQTQFPKEMHEATAKAFGCGIGFVFHLSCIIAGLLKKPFIAVITRLKDFFGNLRISAKVAFHCYWLDVKEEGVVFWIILAIMIANLCLCIDGVVDFVALNN